MLLHEADGYAFTLSVLTGFFAIISPVLVIWASGRRDSTARREDWARQDNVAAKAAVAAQLLVDSNKKVAVVAAELGKETIGKLDQIHTLVNSQMTAAMTDALDADQRTLAMMRELVDVKRKIGEEPTQQSLDAISAVEAKISERRAMLEDRSQRTKGGG